MSIVNDDVNDPIEFVQLRRTNILMCNDFEITDQW